MQIESLGLLSATLTDSLLIPLKMMEILVSQGGVIQDGN